MRSYYDHTRAVSLQRIFPEAANITIKSRRSNGMGTPRVYHQMSPGAIRNKMVVKDRELFLQVKARIEQLLPEWRALNNARVREKCERRAAAHGH
jgi:hypothetical protein